MSSPNGSAPEGAIAVTVPARADHVYVLRAVVASVAARHGASVDAIDDLRITVDEACAQLLGAAGPPATLTVRVARVGPVLEVTTLSDAPVAEWPPEGAAESLSWQVLTALAEDATFERVGAKSAIRFSMALVAPS